jgi:hypothetical protein
MARSTSISVLAFLVLTSPSIASESATHAGKPVAALIGQPSIDPSAQQLVVEIETRASAEPMVLPAWTPLVSSNLARPGPYGAWDLDAPDRRSAMRFSISGAFLGNSGARFDATPATLNSRLAA